MCFLGRCCRCRFWRLTGLVGQFHGLLQTQEGWCRSLVFSHELQLRQDLVLAVVVLQEFFHNVVSITAGGHLAKLVVIITNNASPDFSTVVCLRSVLGMPCALESLLDDMAGGSVSGQLLDARQHLFDDHWLQTVRAVLEQMLDDEVSELMSAQFRRLFGIDLPELSELLGLSMLDQALQNATSEAVSGEFDGVDLLDLFEERILQWVWDFLDDLGQDVVAMLRSVEALHLWHQHLGGSAAGARGDAAYDGLDEAAGDAAVESEVHQSGKEPLEKGFVEEFSVFVCFDRLGCDQDLVMVLLVFKEV
mmetsp:Transcript_24793/g.53921  ORF Transcript_24793/g.53921 Transcript_24793/m.53921 type:complete len:306 (+) Transcript_24793:498-1415(+)